MTVKELRNQLDFSIREGVIDNNNNVCVMVNNGNGWKPIMFSGISVPAVKKDTDCFEETEFLDARIFFVKRNE